MIEKIYYELSIEQKYKKTILKSKLKQYYNISAKYFDVYNSFKISDIPAKQKQAIERKVLGRHLSDDEINTCNQIFDEPMIIKSYIRNKLEELKAEENYIDVFGCLRPEQQNRLLLYFYFLRKSVEEEVQSKWSLTYLNYLLDNNLDTETIPQIYYDFSINKLKKHLIKKGVPEKILEV